MEEKKVDRRVRRTKRQLRMALTTLMLEKSVNTITVHEITELADVNRGTFYSHYKDVNDLLTQLEENIFVNLKKVSQTYDPTEPGSDPFKFIYEILTLVSDNSDICKALMCNAGDFEFRQRLFLELQDGYFLKYAKSLYPHDDKKLEYFCTYAITGILSVATLWLHDGLKEKPIEVAQLCVDFFLQGAAALK